MISTRAFLRLMPAITIPVMPTLSTMATCGSRQISKLRHRRDFGPRRRSPPQLAATKGSVMAQDAPLAAIRQIRISSMRACLGISRFPRPAFLGRVQLYECFRRRHDRGYPKHYCIRSNVRHDGVLAVQRLTDLHRAFLGIYGWNGSLRNLQRRRFIHANV